MISALRQFVWKFLPAKESDFGRTARRYRERLARWPEMLTPGPASPKPERPGILVTPWLQTAVPFYAIETALAMARRGARPALLVDHTNVFHNAGGPEEVQDIEQALAALRGAVEIVRVDQAPAGDAPEGDPAFLRRLLYENAVKRVRGEGGAEDFLAENEGLERQMREHAGRVRRLLHEQKFDWLYIPGGVWAISGLYAAICDELGLDYTTYDSAYSTFVTAQRGVATHLTEVPHVLEYVKRHASPEARRRLAEMAHAQLRQRMEGKDELRLQPQAVSESVTHRCDVLIALNLRWDTAALNRQRLFKSITDWLRHLVNWARAHPQVALVVRQHPCEKIPGMEGSDRFDELLRESVEHGVRFVSAADPVNSYDLMRTAKVVLPFTSRIGIEAAMRGKPAVLASKCYYAQCGIVWSAESIPHYFELIEQALADQLTVSEQAREDAALTYGIAEKCVFLSTIWTPQPVDYEKWCDVPPAELWQTPENVDLLDALLTREPLTQLRYRWLERQG